MIGHRRTPQQQSVFLCFKKHESGGGGIRKGLPPVRSSGGGGASPRYVTDEIASRYLSVLKEKYIDTLVMGCTHYPLIRSTIARTMGDEVTLVNPAYETAVQLRTLLRSMEMDCDGDQEVRVEEKYQFYVSDMAEKFSSFAGFILPGKVKDTMLIDIEKY